VRLKWPESEIVKILWEGDWSPKFGWVLQASRKEVRGIQSSSWTWCEGCQILWQDLQRLRVTCTCTRSFFYFIFLRFFLSPFFLFPFFLFPFFLFLIFHFPFFLFPIFLSPFFLLSFISIRKFHLLFSTYKFMIYLKHYSYRFRHRQSRIPKMVRIH